MEDSPLAEMAEEGNGFSLSEQYINLSYFALLFFLILLIMMMKITRFN